MPNNFSKRTIKLSKIIPVASGIVVFVSFVLPIILINVCGFDFNRYGVYGDLFGCFNLLVSMLAFAGLIYTIYLQREDLELQRNDFVETRKELKLQAEAQMNQTQLMADQLQKSIKFKKADFLHDIVEKITFDKDIVAFIRKIDYGNEKWYDENFHTGSENERLADKALSYLSFILYLRQNKVITDSEFIFVKYILKRVLEDEQVFKYLNFLFHFDKNNFMYKNLVDYAIEKKWYKSWE